MPLFLCLVGSCGNKDLHPWHPFGVGQFIHILSVLKTQNLFYEEMAFITNEMAFIAPHIGLAWDFFPVQATLSHASLPLPPPPHFPLSFPHHTPLPPFFLPPPPPPPHIIPSNLSLLSSASDNFLLSPYPPPPSPQEHWVFQLGLHLTSSLFCVPPSKLFAC